LISGNARFVAQNFPTQLISRTIGYNWFALNVDGGKHSNGSTTFQEVLCAIHPKRAENYDM